MTHTTLNALHAARLHADESWQIFVLQKELFDTNPDWQETTTGEAVLLSGQLVGSRPVWALDRFARDFHLHLAHLGDQRPQFDVTQPGRTVLVWRYGGVWVELWHPNTAADVSEPAIPVFSRRVRPVAVQTTPKPEPAPAAPARSLISRASDRLPFTRNRHKETTTR
jgi:hypothetical protein